MFSVVIYTYKRLSEPHFCQILFDTNKYVHLTQYKHSLSTTLVLSFLIRIQTLNLS